MEAEESMGNGWAGGWVRKAKGKREQLSWFDDDHLPSIGKVPVSSCTCMVEAKK